MTYIDGDFISPCVCIFVGVLFLIKTLKFLHYGQKAFKKYLGETE